MDFTRLLGEIEVVFSDGTESHLAMVQIKGAPFAVLGETDNEPVIKAIRLDPQFMKELPIDHDRALLTHRYMRPLDPRDAAKYQISETDVVQGEGSK